MDSSAAQNQQLPQQPSPLEGFPAATQPVAPPQAVATDPGGFDAASVAQAAQTQAPLPTEAQPPVPNEPQPPAPTQDQTAPPDASQAQYANESALIPGMQKPVPEEFLFEWQALSRPFKQRNRQYFTTIGLIAALVALILVFAGQMLPVAVIVAVIFVIYVLNSTPPGMITHKLTTYGIRVENNLYYWEEMGRFWFTEKYGENILNIEISRFPNRLTLLLGNTSKEDMQLVLSEVLLNQQPPPTAYEKAAQWIQEKLPMDIEA